MSMPVITPGTITRPQAIANIIESVSMEETSISHILNAEGEKLQTVIGSATTGCELLEVNKSVKSMVNSLTKLEMILQLKLEMFSECVC